MIPAVRQMAKEVYEYRELLYALTYRDIQVRYKQAIMGIAWAFFLPMVSLASVVVVRAAMAFMQKQPLEMADVTAGMLRMMPFLLFMGILGSTSGGLKGGMNLAKKIYFPRHLIPLNSMMVVLFDNSISLVGVLVLIAVIPAAPFHFTWLLLLTPIYLLVLMYQALGTGILIGSADLFLRDVKYIVGVVLRFGMFFSPVYYRIEELPEWMRPIMLLNPASAPLEAISQIIVEGQLDYTLWPWLAYSTVMAIIAMTLGFFVFRKTEHLFAEFI